MVDPRQCPIPPGFYVIDKINDDFEEWNFLGFPRNTTTYSSSGLTGYSYRWANSKVRSRYVVAGFEFKIGPEMATRWEIVTDPHTGEQKRIDHEITDMAVNLKFPRSLEFGTGPERGVYMLGIRSYKEGHEEPPLYRKSEGRVGKEYPHPTTPTYYFGEYGGTGSDPRPDIGQIRDGNWHSFVAAVWNQDGSDPTMALWYNPNPTYDWNDFIFLGWSEDKPPKVMPPGPPLRRDIIYSDDDVIYEDGVGWFKARHVVEIRIDGIPPGKIAVRNLFAANVGAYQGGPLRFYGPTLRALLGTRGFTSFPYSIRTIAETLGLTIPISLKDFIERLQKNIF